MDLAVRQPYGDFEKELTKLSDINTKATDVKGDSLAFRANAAIAITMTGMLDGQNR